MNMFDDVLIHYGMPRRSGRYPWGSGEDPYQHSRDFVSRYNELESSGLSHDDILNVMGLSTTQYRALNAIANNERRLYQIRTAESLRADGLNNTEIAKKMGLPSESSVRSLLDESAKNRTSQAMELADRLKANIKSKGIVDVGTGVERDLNVSNEKLKVAEEILAQEGYKVYSFRVPQVNNPGKWTTVKALCPPGTEYKDVYDAANKGEINTITDYTSVPNSVDGNTKSQWVPKPPANMDLSRVKIRYKEESDGKGNTGDDYDGMIEIRPGVPDLSLGNSRYAQVRILVDNDKYMKGMAVYSDNIPDGYDVVFNTNKKTGTPPADVFKKIKSDPDNPFGSLIRENGQNEYIDPKTGETKLGLINKTREEGDWERWSRNLPSQFLAKQNISLIKKQIGISVADKEAEFAEIMQLTNPTVKKQMLMSFAEDCDAAAVQLKAAALPRQRYQVLIPIPSLKDNEVYAPNYQNGEMLSLVRFPHGGTFEIPQLIVNNNNKQGKSLLGTTPLDAIGVNKSVADRLSGADYDGDAVLCIPTNTKIKITSTPALEGLKGFDSKSYKYDDHKVDSNGDEHYYRNGKEFRIMRNTQNEMGRISNLITDMTVKGASPDELARAVRHSMVVIDAEKHKLDYKQSEIDNDIKSLKNLYQNGGGASTIFSLASSEDHVDKRKGQPKINLKGKEWYDPNKPEGSLIYKTAPDKELYYTKKEKNKKTGEEVEKIVKRTESVSKMSNVDDAYKLTTNTGNRKEEIYADYANYLKNMANTARLESTRQGKIAYSRTAKEKYSEEVKELNSALNIAKKNQPRERQAQILANSTAKAMKLDNPAMSKEEYRKLSQRELNKARAKLGAKKEKIKPTEKQIEAIQAGAVSENVLREILNNMDSSDIRKAFTPRTVSAALSSAKISQIKAKANSGFTTDEIAKELGVSASTVRKYLTK